MQEPAQHQMAKLLGEIPASLVTQHVYRNRVYITKRSAPYASATSSRWVSDLGKRPGFSALLSYLRPRPPNRTLVNDGSRRKTACSLWAWRSISSFQRMLNSNEGKGLFVELDVLGYE
jgi:hypothetical protein